MRLKNYINNEKIGNGITFVDIDETLFKTFARINIVKNNEIIGSLSNSEYNNYKLKDGESFEYSEFRNSKLFYETSKPIKKMFNRIIHILERIEKKNTKSKVVLLTARENFDDKEIFLNTFRKHGFPIDKTYVIRAGTRKEETIPEKKKFAVLEYLNTGLYTRCRIFDDYLKTCKQFLQLQNEVTDEIIEKIKKQYNITSNGNIIKFEAYHVQENGDVLEVK
jgi:hypothetical protein